MRILLVSQHYWPETFRINEVVESLREAGCEVAVLTGQPNYPDGEVFDSYRACGIGKEMHPDGYEIYRVPIIPRGRGGAIRMLGNYASFLLGSMTVGPWLLRGREYDVVFVYAISPILQAITGGLFKKLKGAPLVIWVQDLWPHSLEATGYIRNRTILSAVALLTRWIYRSADLLLVQSPAFIDEVRRMARDVPVKYHLNPGELALTRPDRRQHGFTLKPGFNVVFTGNVGTAQSPQTILDAAMLLAERSDIRIVIVGSGSRLEWVRQEISRRDLKNVDLAGRMPQEQMPEVYAQASVLLATLSRRDNFSRTVPSKIPSYLAAGRPVICSMDGEGAIVVSSAGAGIACPAEDPEALAAAILRLAAASPEDRAAMGQAGRAYFDRHFDPTMLAGRLKQAFGEAVAARG